MEVHTRERSTTIARTAATTKRTIRISKGMKQNISMRLHSMTGLAMSKFITPILPIVSNLHMKSNTRRYAK